MARKTALANQFGALGRQGGEAFGGRQIDFQGLEVAVVDADQASAQPGRPFVLGLVMEVGS